MTRRELQKLFAAGIAGSRATYASTFPATYAEASRQPLADRLEFFDADVIFGPRLLDAEKNIIDPPLLSADDVLRALDRYHIKEALLFHSACKAAKDPEGNTLLLRAVGRQPRLHACWSIVPDAAGRLPSPELVLRSLREHGLKAARVFPVNHGYKLDEIGDILTAFERQKVPLIADFGITFPHNDRTDWRAVEAVLRAHPKLDVILAHPPSRQNQHLFELMELSPRFHINPAGFRIHQEVTAMSKLFGAGAVVYGSHLPYYTAAAALAEVIYSDLSFAEQKRIAGDTLRSMLAQAAP